MHLGNDYSALLSWLSAKSQGGEWLLRIEDIDPQRSRREYALLLMDDLQWMGLQWDGEPLWQSQRADIYQHYYDLLQRQGLTYPCYCTRADLLATQAPHESDGRVVYPGTCRPKKKSLTAPPTAPEGASFDGVHGNTSPSGDERGATGASMRLIVPDSDITFVDRHYGPQRVNLAHQVGDFIIRRKDGAWAYQLAVVVDDALTGVNEVVRGRDLLLSVPQQIYVAELLGFAPPQFIHVPLLCNTEGQRLSKRDKSLDMSQLRQRFTPAALTGVLAYVAGLQSEPLPLSLNEALQLFSWDKVPCHDITVRAL